MVTDTLAYNQTCPCAVFVDEVTPGGPADRQGIQKGDVLTQCSAVVLKAGKEGAYEENGYGEVVYDNWKVSACSKWT